MRKEKILEILENAKDGNGAVPMRLVRTAFDKLPEPCEDTISRQAAIDICANAIDLWHGQLGEGALVAVRDKIAELTPAEPKRGRWIEISSINHTYKCSVCGRLLVNITDGRNNVSKHYPYCHCGADMRGEQHETD